MNQKFVVAFSLLCLSVPAQQTSPDVPRFTKDGELMRPENYREWIFLSSGLGMTYGFVERAANAAPRFDNVFVTPQAYKAFLETGTWPDKAMFALEIRSSASKGSINKEGHYQEDTVGLEIEVKDESRFPGKWAFFDFRGSGTSAKPIPKSASCYACHSTNGAVDNTFVQFYPTLLPIAKAKGTLKSRTGKDGE
ncbi:MAG: cytochrome P460 family protein [Acidobacteriota bacterium]|nr:cytochrome P460 family protein [Acidobacteriota bacterium]